MRGRVQLVMFRDFTKRKAEEFGIVGTVRNEKDGTVRVIAEGDETHLVLFFETIGKRAIPFPSGFHRDKPQRPDERVF